jgi:hypothetical protein
MKAWSYAHTGIHTPSSRIALSFKQVFTPPPPTWLDYGKITWLIEVLECPYILWHMLYRYLYSLVSMSPPIVQPRLSLRCLLCGLQEAGDSTKEMLGCCIRGYFNLSQPPPPTNETAGVLSDLTDLLNDDCRYYTAINCLESFWVRSDFFRDI